MAHGENRRIENELRDATTQSIGNFEIGRDFRFFSNPLTGQGADIFVFNPEDTEQSDFFSKEEFFKEGGVGQFLGQQGAATNFGRVDDADFNQFFQDFQNTQEGVRSFFDNPEADVVEAEFQSQLTQAQEAGLDTSGITNSQELGAALAATRGITPEFFDTEGGLVDPTPGQGFNELSEQGFKPPEEKEALGAGETNESGTGRTLGPNVSQEEQLVSQAQSQIDSLGEGGGMAQGQAVQLAKTNTPTFQYIDTSGRIREVKATDSDEALRLAQNIAPNSGVQQTSLPQSMPTGLPAPAEQSPVPPAIPPNPAAIAPVVAISLAPNSSSPSACPVPNNAPDIAPSLPVLNA